MKRPLKPSDVPPGSVFRQDTTFKPGEYCVPSSVREHGVHLLTEFLGWEDLKNSLWRILRPGESWQPCYVEEFNHADYKPGEEVDVETAKKLFAAGVKLEFRCDDGDPTWDKVVFPGWEPGSYYRLATAKTVRDIRPDELPERFEVVWPDGARSIWVKQNVAEIYIRSAIEQGCKWRTDLNANELKSFTVEE